MIIKKWNYSTLLYVHLDFVVLLNFSQWITSVNSKQMPHDVKFFYCKTNTEKQFGKNLIKVSP